MYPDARSSIRFERLREGVQDAEKIRILREQLERSSSTDAPTKLAMLNEEVKKFNYDRVPPTPCNEMLHQGKKILEELSR